MGLFASFRPPQPCLRCSPGCCDSSVWSLSDFEQIENGGMTGAVNLVSVCASLLSTWPSESITEWMTLVFFLNKQSSLCPTTWLRHLLLKSIYSSIHNSRSVCPAVLFTHLDTALCLPRTGRQILVSGHQRMRTSRLLRKSSGGHVGRRSKNSCFVFLPFVCVNCSIGAQIGLRPFPGSARRRRSATVLNLTPKTSRMKEFL